MRSFWVFALVVFHSYVFSSPITWPTATSRVGQDIYEACDSDLYIAEFLHPEHGYNCINVSARSYSDTPISSGSSSGEQIAMCFDGALVICLCGRGLGHCPSDYRVARYYVCSNPFEFPDTEPVAEAYDGPYARFIASALAYDCTKPTGETKTDPNKGDSYGDSNVDDNSTGGVGGDGGTGGDSGTGDDGGTGDDDGTGDVDPADYDCVQSPGSDIDWATAYSECSAALAEVLFPFEFSPGGPKYFDGTGGSGVCTYPGSSSSTPCICSHGQCNWSGSSYYANCLSGCYELVGDSVSTTGCYKIFDSFPFGVTVNCTLTIPKPGGGNWTREWSVPETSSCEASCQQYRDEYSDAFPGDSGGDSGPEDPEDYEDCETTSGCHWVGAPAGYGVCHCDDDGENGPVGDEGTGPKGPNRGQNGNGNSQCGKGSDGLGCESTQKEVLSQVSEFGENFENFSGWLQNPGSPPTSDITSLGSQFQSDVDSETFSNSIFQDSNFLTWKTKLLEQIHSIRSEANTLANTVVFEPSSGSTIYGCLEFTILEQHIGPECLSEYLQPVIPYLKAMFDFLKYLIGLIILFKKD